MADGHYFLQMCMRENGRLLNLANQAEAEAEQMDLPEEIKGKLRSAYGKARLLVSQKMEQFKGLCANNINQVKLQFNVLSWTAVPERLLAFLI